MSGLGLLSGSAGDPVASYGLAGLAGGPSAAPSPAPSQIPAPTSPGPSGGLPPLPQGFTLDAAPQQSAPAAVPPLPTGFTLDAPQPSGVGIDATGYPLVPDEPKPAAQPAQPDGFLARADNVVRTAFDQVTMGAGKYIDAAETAAEQPLFHGGSNAPSFGQRYSDDLAAEKARLASVPTAVKIATGIPAGLATVSGVGMLGKAALAGARYIPGVGAALDAAGSAIEPASNLLSQVPGASVVAPVAKSAAIGAGYGAAQGFGDTDGGFQNRLAGALQGGTVGAIAGPLVEGSINLLARGAGAVGNYFSEAGQGAKVPLLDAAGQSLIGSTGQAVAATSGVTQAARNNLLSSVSDLPAARAALDQPTEFVPGSQPTTFQVTGDTGLGQKELALRNAPGTSTAFMDRANQQNAARVGAIASAAPADASPLDLLDSLNAQRTALQAQRDQAVGQVQQQATQAADALGSIPGGDASTTRQQLGQALRAPLAAGDQAAKANVSKLSDAIDPNGTLAVDMTPIRDQAQAVLASIGPNAAKPAGAEASILNIAASLPDVQSFRDLADLRQQISDTIRGARPNPERAQEVRRLSMLLDGVHDAMSGAVSDPNVPIPTATPVSAPVAAPNVGSDVFTPSGERIGVTYELANAPDLVTSHNADMTPNPAFPPELQPRDRDRAASAVQVANIASRLQPERLGASSTVADGAPIVGPDNVVESGNGRVLGLRQAYQANGPQAQGYRDWLASQGHDTAGIDQPVLIRRRVTDLTPGQRVAFAAEGNAPTTLALSAPEQAAGDARRLTPDVLGQVQPGDVTDPANRDFVRSFARNVVDPAQSGSFAAADGSLSQQGAGRVRAALVHRAYGDDGLSAALSESTDPHAKVLAGAMQDAAGPMAQLKAGIDAGRVDPAVNLAPHLVEAAQAVQQARQRGLSLADHIGQADVFNPISAPAQRLLRAAYGPNLSGRMSREQFGSMLGTYAKHAAEQSTSGNLFGLNLTRDQLLDGVEARYGKAVTGSGQPTHATPSRQGAGGDGYQTQRPLNGAGGQAASSGRGGEGGQASARILEQPPSALTPNFDASAAARYDAMRAAHADRKATYGDRAPGVGAVLAPGPTSGSFEMADSAVPSAIFAKGPGGAERVQAALRAGLTPRQIGDAAAFDLRQSAARDDGVIDPVRAGRWRQQHADAFSALAQADPKIARQFDTAQQMGARLFDLQAKRATVEATNPNRPGAPAPDSAEAHVQALRAFETSAARHFLGERVDPARTIGALLMKQSSVADMRSLARLTANDPAAQAGIQRAAVDHIFQRLQGNSLAGQTGTEKLKSDHFQTFMKTAAPALREIMTPKQVEMLQAVAMDLQRANRSVDGTRVAGGSDTAQKAALLAGGMRSTLLGSIRDTAVAGGITLAGYLKGGPIGGFIANKGAALLSNMRAAGIAQTEDLVKEAMLNPGLARVLLTEVTPANAHNVASALSAQIGRIAAARAAHVAGAISPPQPARQ